MDTMHEIQLKTTDFDTAIKDGKVKLSGKQAVLEEFMGMLDDYNFWFNIVTP
jgi:alkyl sulfatase BDS1-like metallo-beta-lactamase superfamily hydrolase